MRRLPPLAAVRVFEAAARHGNFTRAAVELGMTQAAVSYQVKLLEERLGISLFVRSKQGVLLTEMASRIVPQVTGAFDALDDAFAAVRVENEAVLTISAPQTFATNWLSARLGAFQLARPDLAVRLHVSDEMVDFSDGDVDVAVRGAVTPAGPGLASNFLMRMPVTPLASPMLLARHPPVREPADLLAMPRLSPDDDWWSLWFHAAMGSDCDFGGRGIRFASQVLDGHAAIAGHGVAILSPPMWQAAIDSGLLVQPLPHVVNYRNGLWLVYPEAKRALAKVRVFRDWLLEEVREAMGGEPGDVLVPPDAVAEG